MAETTSFKNQSDSKTSTFSKMVYQKSIATSDETLSDIFTLSDAITVFQQRLGHNFKDINLLIRAFSHSSFVHEYKQKEISSYERLEFLGDSIVNSYVTTSLFNLYPNFSEGKLSKLRSALVNEYSLAKIAKYLGIGEFVLLGRGELDNDISSSIISDVFEAIVGAITLDGGIDEAFSVLHKIIEAYEAYKNEEFFSSDKLAYFDPKTTLQEITMKKYKCLPKYEASTHEDGFFVTLFICDVEMAKTTSKSKKEAMKILALECLETKCYENIKTQQN
jgi:ribonuclease-3